MSSISFWPELFSNLSPEVPSLQVISLLLFIHHSLKLWQKNITNLFLCKLLEPWRLSMILPLGTYFVPTSTFFYLHPTSPRLSVLARHMLTISVHVSSGRNLGTFVPWLASGWTQDLQPYSELNPSSVMLESVTWLLLLVEFFARYLALRFSPNRKKVR